MVALKQKDASRRSWQEHVRGRIFLVVGVVVLVLVALSSYVVKSRNGVHMQIDEERLDQAAKQREAVDALKKLGCGVAYDYMHAYARSCDRTEYDVDYADPPRIPESQLKALGRDYFAYVDAIYVTDPKSLQFVKDLPQVRTIELVGPKIDDRALSLLKEVPSLRSLRIHKVPLTDAGVAHIGDLHHLIQLIVSETSLSDDALVKIAQMPSLEQLLLRKTGTSHAGVAHLAKMVELRTLELSDAAITDRAMEHLKNLRGLTVLNLENASITDAGLNHLHSLESLYSIVLTGSKVTDEGTEKLRCALPNINIHPPRKAGKRTGNSAGGTRNRDAPQGQRSLTACSGKDLEHVVVVPTTSAAFHGHAVFLGMLLQQG
jgi:hypothetical protein